MKDKDFRRKLRLLVIPIAFQQFMSALVSASDAVMLGFISQSAMSAVSLAGQIAFVYSLFLFGVNMGTSVYSAQYYGKGDLRAVERILGIGLDLALIIGAVFTALAIAVPSSLMRIFTKDPELVSIGAKYLRVVGGSYAMMGASQILLTVMKNCGKATKSSIISAASMGANIILNGVFIYFLKMGAAGAALATAISKALELGWALIEVQTSGEIVARRKHMLKIDKVLFGDFVKTTAPALGNMLAWGCGFTMYSVIMGRMSSDAVAANAIANIIKQLLICVCTGVATGGSIIVGNELGRGKLDEAKESGAKVCRIAIISGLITGAIVLLFIPFVDLMGSLTPDAKRYLKIMLAVCSYYVAGKSVNMTTIAGIFSAGGDSRFGFVCDSITMWAVTVPIGLVAAFVLKLPVPVVYVMINVDEIVKLPAVYVRYKQYKWVKDLTR